MANKTISDLKMEKQVIQKKRKNKKRSHIVIMSRRKGKRIKADKERSNY